jgi:hypothetical protein
MIKTMDQNKCSIKIQLSKLVSTGFKMLFKEFTQADMQLRTLI